MPTKKQIRRQQKLKRHEYEEVYVDEEGRELDPAEAEERLGAKQPAQGGESERRSSLSPARAARSSRRRCGGRCDADCSSSR